MLVIVTTPQVGKSAIWPAATVQYSLIIEPGVEQHFYEAEDLEDNIITQKKKKYMNP